MQSKNKRAPTAAERRHIVAVKSLPCSVCDAPGPSDCHEIKQGQWYTSVARSRLPAWRRRLIAPSKGRSNGFHTASNGLIPGVKRRIPYPPCRSVL